MPRRQPPAQAPRRSRPASVPWYLWAGVLAVTSASVGGAWDVSWHRSIGRDSFWTPAHMAIYACGVLAAIIGGWLVAQCTFGRDPKLRAASVQVFGLRAPLGVFLAGWGGIAMLTSAPFDNWWHNAYGLDVKIVSPPHALLILGIRAIAVGMMFLILAAMNRAAERRNRRPTPPARASSFISAAWPSAARCSFYRSTPRTSSCIAPRLHRHGHRGCPLLFADLLAGLALPLGGDHHGSDLYGVRDRRDPDPAAVPGAAQAGPGLHPVTHMVPEKFPMLLLAPALPSICCGSGCAAGSPGRSRCSPGSSSSRS